MDRTNLWFPRRGCLGRIGGIVIRSAGMSNVSTAIFPLQPVGASRIGPAAWAVLATTAADWGLKNALARTPAVSQAIACRAHSFSLVGWASSACPP
jgi:hypothetical protein